jgi:hypothetical protein
MNGWDALPLSSPKIDDSFKLATDHVGGRLTKKLTGFKRRDVSSPFRYYIYTLIYQSIHVNYHRRSTLIALAYHQHMIIDTDQMIKAYYENFKHSLGPYLDNL